MYQQTCMSAVFLLLSGFTWGLFCHNKGVLMQKVSYMGNGSTTEFFFNFPYFENSNIVVTVNNGSAPAYNVIGTSAGLDADIPYTCGKVVFETAPSSIDSITIARSLPLSRIADYQPLAQIQPTILNQDLNYMMEVLKDLQDELDVLRGQYSDITDKESTDILLAKITAISDAITTVSQQIIDLGDISTIHDSISTLNTRTTGLFDYVTEIQKPTAENNYTWYRKYKSGWVEQGGEITATSVADGAGSSGNNSIILPVIMANDHYHINLQTQVGSSGWDYANGVILNSRSTTKLTLKVLAGTGSIPLFWEVSGLYAE